MDRRFYKITAWCLCAGLAMSGFAGCGKDSATEETSESGQTASVTTALETVAETATETSLTETSVATEISEMTQTQETYEVIDLESDVQQYVNTFITNFVEQNFYDYDRETADIERMIDFVHLHLKINAHDLISYAVKGDLDYEVFSIDDVQRVASEYLGVLITEEDYAALPVPPETFGDQPAGPYFEDGKIWYEASDGESYNRIGIVNSFLNPGDGTLIMEFDVYEIDLDTYLSLNADEIREYYALTSEQAENDPSLTKVRTGTARVGATQSGGYYLITYTTADVTGS